MTASTQTEIADRPFAAVSDLIREHGRAHPHKPAIVAGESGLSWGAFDALLDRIAAALARDGIGKGQAVAICAAMSIDSLCLFFGALRAGAVAVPLSPALSAAALGKMLADSEAARIFVDEGGGAALGATAGLPLVALPLDGWLDGAPLAFQHISVAPDDPCNLIYSSGTTGTPKGVVQPHAMRWAHIQRGAALGYGRDSVTLVSTPLYSNTTLVSIYPTIGLGGTLILMPKFDAASFLALSQRHRVTHAMLVPVQYRRIMALPDFGAHDLSAYRMKFCTSAPFSAALKADVLARWPGGLIEYYGMTEGGGTCILRAHAHPGKLASVGQPGPGSDIRLIDDAGVEVADGGTGEVVGRSPGMMTGYHKLPAQTALAEWHDPAGRRFIRTGDVGRFDADGFLYLVDRKKDLIISGGFNIYPSELEALLAADPDIEEAAVVGMPSPEWGETPVAFVVARAGRPLDLAALQAQVNRRLERFQRLSAVHQIATLPRSEIGKVLKRQLVDTCGSPQANQK